MNAPDAQDTVSLYSARKLVAPLAVSLAFFALAVGVCPWIGPTRLNVHEALFGPADNNDMQILMSARLPRVALAAVTGAALALAGMVFQAMLRNPLAEPYTLGLAAGASLGAALAIKFGVEATVIGALGAKFGVAPLPVAAFAGCLLSVALVYWVARGRGQLPATTLILAGVIVSFFLSAVMLFLWYWRTDFVDSHQITRWTMGSLAVTDFGPVWRAAASVLAGGLLLLAMARPLNLLATGEALAHSRGVNVRRLKQLVFLGASLLTAAVVAVSGPIGFIGIIVPHTARLLFGADHRVLMPCSALLGGAFLIVCDTLCRTLMPPLELPVGVLTALLGGPFFIGLLRREKRQG
jgi:iron complex transport system permease protein